MIFGIAGLIEELPHGSRCLGFVVEWQEACLHPDPATINVGHHVVSMSSTAKEAEPQQNKKGNHYHRDQGQDSGNHLTRPKISDRWREDGELGSRRIDGQAATGLRQLSGSEGVNVLWLLVECRSHRKCERGTASGSLHRLVRCWTAFTSVRVERCKALRRGSQVDQPTGKC
jgi:hypothetical protein